MTSSPTSLTVHFSVPLLPPSVNSIWRKKARGGMYLSREANAFIEAVGILGPKEIVLGLCEVQITFRIQEKQLLRWDLDNLLKISIDSLAKAGILKDDRYVSRIFACKVAAGSRSEEATDFTVKAI